ncbi:MAG: hypothetical protein KDE27_28745 [Planctomycetes bacterium]|nr:hypothetical protein [Planctomycetota bacterium]
MDGALAGFLGEDSAACDRCGRPVRNRQQVVGIVHGVGSPLGQVGCREKSGAKTP